VKLGKGTAWNAAGFKPRKRPVRAILIVFTLSAISWALLIGISLAIWTIL
jgi:hypothetical protein